MLTNEQIEVLRLLLRWEPRTENAEALTAAIALAERVRDAQVGKVDTLAGSDAVVVCELADAASLFKKRVAQVVVE